MEPLPESADPGWPFPFTPQDWEQTPPAVQAVSVHVVAVRETCSLVSMPRMIKAHEHHPTFPT